MDDLDFTVSASGTFGNFMWEYPEESKKLLREVQKKCGNEVVCGIMEMQKTSVLTLLHIQLGILFSGPLAPILDEYIQRCLEDMAEGVLSIYRSSQSL